MKRSFSIKKADFGNLLEFLAKKYGGPTYSEELIIYVSCDEHVRVSINEEGFFWSWRDPSLGKNKYNKSNHNIRTGLSGIKDKLLFLSMAYGNRGTISNCVTYNYYDVYSGLLVQVREDTLIGPLLTLNAPPNYFRSTRNKAHYKSLRKGTFAFLELTYPGDEEELTHKVEEFIHDSISDNKVLNTKILDFCKRRGIVNLISKGSTYREHLNARSNDYSFQEKLYEELTGHQLLSIESHTSKKKPSPASIIIPCYNSEDSILYTLAAIEGQSIDQECLKECEVIIIDDGSQTPIRSVINEEEYTFKLIIVSISKNQSVSSARDIGVTVSRHNFLIFIDSDILLSKNYLMDQISRLSTVDNAVFVSFKKNISRDHEILDVNLLRKGIERPDKYDDLRIRKTVSPQSVGNYKVDGTETLNILEDTNYFKNFHGSRVFGVYDLSCMVIGHNFCCTRKVIDKSSPFSKLIKGWGMEDVFFGLKVISNGCFVIPTLSSGVYHIDHPPRSGGSNRKMEEYRANTKIIEDFLSSVVN